METKENKYRGPPPRKDLVISPSKERDWKGNDLFGVNNNTMSKEERTITPPSKLGLGLGPNEEYVDPHLKAKRDYGSDYAKLALQGGQKDLLNMDFPSEMDSSRKQKHSENISEYNRVAQQGGHKDLLRMDGEQDQEPGRKQKGCDNVSDYNRIAMQGGHKDLLRIDENKPSANKVAYNRNGGDWFSHGADASAQQRITKPAAPSPVKHVNTKHSSDESGLFATNNDVKETNYYAKGNTTDEAAPTAPIVNSNKPRKATSGVIGDYEVTPQKSGKKRFDQSTQQREAPFATY